MHAVLERSPMEARMARLESDVAHMRQDITEIKTDIREVKSGIQAIRADRSRSKLALAESMANLRGEFTAMRSEMQEGFAKLETRLVRSELITRIEMLLIGAALLGIMARVFKWL